MNGGQDLGGMDGFGPVIPEENEPVFHGDWEKRVFALTLAMGATGRWNIDQSRFARESQAPAVYLSSSYYQIWLTGLQRLMLEHGLITEQELASGLAQLDGVSAQSLNIKPLAAQDVPVTMGRGGPTERSLSSAPLFSVGQSVRLRNMNPAAHTRLPRYIRGRRGTIRTVQDPHVYPDTNALADGQRSEDPQWLYSVQFDAHELWGDDTSADAILVDCWEPYLMPASNSTGD